MFVEHLKEQLETKKKSLASAMRLAERAEEYGNMERAESMLKMALRIEDEIEEIEREIEREERWNKRK